MKSNTVQLVIDVGTGGVQMKRCRSNIVWQELNKGERSAVIKCLKNITAMFNGKINEEEPKRFCYQCRELLPVSSFYKRSDNGKPRSICKECEKENGRRYRASGKWGMCEKSCSNCARTECMKKLKGLNSDFGKTCRDYK